MIGVLGANGKIGSEIVKALSTLVPEIEIKLGCHRNMEKDKDHWHIVDANDIESINNFSKHCKLIINASGIAIKNQIKIPVVEMGDHDSYQDLTYQGFSFIYGCGAVPGIIGLIPQKLAEKFDSLKTMRMYYLINEPLTMTAALDMTANFHINKNKASVKIINHEPEKIPFLGDNVYKYRFVDTESNTVDDLLNITDSEWFMVRDSDDFEQLFSKQYDSRKELAEQICKLSKIKQLGIKNSISFVVELTGIKDKKEKAVSCYIQSSSPSALSGKACAAAAVALYNQSISEGVYRMALCKEWKEIWKNLKQLNPFDIFLTYPYLFRDMEIEEEGEL